MQAHWLDSGDAISADRLRSEGVIYEQLPMDEQGYQPKLDELKNHRGYIEQDIVELRPDNPKLEEICAKFKDEHLHEEDEVRFVLEGEGVFDIRSESDDWMRVQVDQGDLIVVPAKRYHRFTLTESKNIRCVRLFQDQSGWVPYYRDNAA
jgi:1,2-dihydroxy-3-keto-5-methylthiopentene dioxygenase